MNEMFNPHSFNPFTNRACTHLTSQLAAARARRVPARAPFPHRGLRLLANRLAAVGHLAGGPAVGGWAWRAHFTSHQVLMCCSSHLAFPALCLGSLCLGFLMRLLVASMLGAAALSPPRPNHAMSRRLVSTGLLVAPVWQLATPQPCAAITTAQAQLAASGLASNEDRRKITTEARQEWISERVKRYSAAALSYVGGYSLLIRLTRGW